MKRIILLLLLPMLLMVGCQDIISEAPRAASGVKKVTVKVTTNAQGRTIEQENVASRLKMDNKPGSIKHLYVLSAYSGQAIIYSTVKGKVTSSGKRLTPTSTVANDGDFRGTDDAFEVKIGNYNRWTSEVLQDDGTYGSSIPYLFWWDSAGKYHQHYVSGGQIIHISDQPMPVKSVTINLETKVVQ